MILPSPLGRHVVAAAAAPHSNSNGLFQVLLAFLLASFSLLLLLPTQFARGFSAGSSVFLPAASCGGGVQRNQKQGRRTTTPFWRNSAAACNNQHAFLLLANNRRSSDDDGNNKNTNDRGGGSVTLESIMEKQRRQSLMEALFNVKGSKKERLVQVHLQGKASLATGSGSSNQTIGRWFFGPQEPGGDCLVLSTTRPSLPPPSAATSNTKNTKPIIPCMLVPLVNPNQLALVETAYLGRPISNTRLWRLNMLVVNRDQALFDGIPWSRWTMDPSLRNRDAAGNVINAKFHLGKRDAYNVMMGKDWRGQSLAMANLAHQLRQKLDRLPSSTSASKQDDDDDDDEDEDEDEEENASTLARRMLELEMKELEMDIAECDYQLSILNTKHNEDDARETDREELESKRQSLVQCLQARRERFQQVTATSKQQSSSSSLVTQALDRIQQDASNSPNKAPYRGATGYEPYLDQNENETPPYTSPYDMLVEILENQLQAQVIGAVLENTSWLPSTIAMGGVLVLRRKTAREKISIAGQEIVISNEEHDYGNPGVTGGETFLVECDADEAIGMSLACNIPLQVESFLLERSSVMAQPKQQQEEQQQFDDDDSNSDNNVWSTNRRRRRRLGLPEWETVDPELSVLFEGQAGNMSTTERVAPIRIPRTTMSLYDSLFEPTPSSSRKQQELFPTDNPVQSLSAYDAMSNQDKAITLMTMSNFPREKRLPRPRAVRQSEQEQQQDGNSGGGTPQNALDELLLPLIDESVRREYRLRDAKRRGDTDLVEQLQRETSRRQVAKAKAAEARANYAKYEQNDGVAEWWQNEADLYDSLKADVTQDDGSYTRFLDKDEDYERNRRRLAARVNKKKFGPLLDGVD
jgi:hypothetical protein